MSENRGRFICPVWGPWRSQSRPVVGRGRIADPFRVLKGGCKVEELGIEGASSRHRVITLYAVRAWRIRLMTLLGRPGPETQAEVVFTDGDQPADGDPGDRDAGRLPEARPAAGSPDQVAGVQPAGDRGGLLRRGGRTATGSAGIAYTGFRCGGPMLLCSSHRGVHKPVRAGPAAARNIPVRAASTLLARCYRPYRSQAASCSWPAVIIMLPQAAIRGQKESQV